jgi:hypothetical protein
MDIKGGVETPPNEQELKVRTSLKNNNNTNYHEQ